MPEGTIRVRGLTELMGALRHAEKNTKPIVRQTLLHAGDIVRDDAERLFSAYGKAGAGAARYGGSRASHADSAAAYTVRLRKGGISLESRKRKTTGLHPEYGEVQMRHAFLPARARNMERIKTEFVRAAETLASYFHY